MEERGQEPQIKNGDQKNKKNDSINASIQKNFTSLNQFQTQLGILKGKKQKSITSDADQKIVPSILKETKLSGKKLFQDINEKEQKSSKLQKGENSSFKIMQKQIIDVKDLQNFDESRKQKFAQQLPKEKINFEKNEKKKEKLQNDSIQTTQKGSKTLTNTEATQLRMNFQNQSTENIKYNFLHQIQKKSSGMQNQNSIIFNNTHQQKSQIDEQKAYPQNQNESPKLQVNQQNYVVNSLKSNTNINQESEKQIQIAQGSLNQQMRTQTSLFSHPLKINNQANAYSISSGLNLKNDLSLQFLKSQSIFGPQQQQNNQMQNPQNYAYPTNIPLNQTAQQPISNIQNQPINININNYFLDSYQPNKQEMSKWYQNQNSFLKGSNTQAFLASKSMQIINQNYVPQNFIQKTQRKILVKNEITGVHQYIFYKQADRLQKVRQKKLLKMKQVNNFQGQNLKQKRQKIESRQIVARKRQRGNTGRFVSKDCSTILNTDLDQSTYKIEDQEF